MTGTTTAERLAWALDKLDECGKATEFTIGMCRSIADCREHLAALSPSRSPVPVAWLVLDITGHEPVARFMVREADTHLYQRNGCEITPLYASPAPVQGDVAGLEPPDKFNGLAGAPLDPSSEAPSHSEIEPDDYHPKANRRPYQQSSGGREAGRRDEVFAGGPQRSERCPGPRSHGEASDEVAGTAPGDAYAPSPGAASAEWLRDTIIYLDDGLWEKAGERLNDESWARIDRILSALAAPPSPSKADVGALVGALGDAKSLLNKIALERRKLGPLATQAQQMAHRLASFRASHDGGL